MGSVPPQPNVTSKPNSTRITSTVGYLTSGFGRGGVGKNQLTEIIILAEK